MSRYRRPYSIVEFSQPHGRLISKVKFIRHITTKPEKFKSTHKLFEKSGQYRAAPIPPRHFDSERSRAAFFSRFADLYTFPMFTVTAVTHHTDDTRHPSIMVTNRDGYKYIFGKLPEGTQRVITESKIRLGKLKLVFLTGTITSWLEIGGLPGLFLTMTDATNKGVDVYAPCHRALTYIVATWRSFVFRKGMDLNIFPTPEQGIFGDNNVAIRTIRIPSKIVSEKRLDSKVDTRLQKLVSMMFPRDTSKVNSEDPDSYKTDHTSTERHTHTSLPDTNDYVDLPSQDAVSYHVRFLPLRGKFDLNRAKALGLSPGLKFKNLQEGESVQNDAGDTIYPEQVMLLPQTFRNLLIIDIPNANYFENTLLSDKWFAPQKETSQENTGIVYHLLGADIDFASEEYQRFIERFPADCVHVISHPKTAANTLVFSRAAENLLTLKCVQPDHYNLARTAEHMPQDDPNGNCFSLHQHQEFTIHPNRIEHKNEKVARRTWASLYDEKIPRLALPNVQKSAIIGASPLSLDITHAKPLKDQVHIVTLGTGLALPSIFRNVLSTVVRIPRIVNGQLEVRLVLLDGGENTLGSLTRNFGHGKGEQLRQVLRELLLIHLSHLHADHHLGLVPIIKEWFNVNRDNSKALYLVAPWQYDTFIQEWFSFEKQSHEIDMSRIVYISCEDFLEKGQKRRPQYLKMSLEDFECQYDQSDLLQQVEREPLRPIDSASIAKMYSDLGIEQMETCRALHCAWAYSASITFKLDESQTFKLSSSGDTRPNPRFVNIGYDSDLLVHESSLDSDLIEEALAKKHSTMIEALSVSRFMNCPKVILTHFSTRYSYKNDISTVPERLEAEAVKLEQYLKESNALPNIFTMESIARPKKAFCDMSICFAFDAMHVRYESVDCQQSVQEIISRVFCDELAKDDEKMKRHAERVAEKREAKRTARLSKKRKNSA